MTLNHYNVGDKIILEDINATSELKSKLMDMGLTIGVYFKIINKTKKGPMLIEVRGTRLAVSEEVANCLVGNFA